MRMNDATYQRYHRNLRNTRGPANRFMCVKCGKQAHDWAQLKNLSGFSPWDYDPMCRSCHQKYDVTDERRERIGDLLRGRSHTEQAKANMSLGHAHGDGTKCKRGHDLSDPNNRVKGRGPRSCAECARVRAREWKTKNA